MSAANVKFALPPRSKRVVNDEPTAKEAARERDWKKMIRNAWILAVAWCVSNPGWFVSVFFHLGLAACLTDALFHESKRDDRLILQVMPGGDLGGTEFDTILGGSPPGDSALEISEAPTSLQKTLLEASANLENSGLVALGTPTAMSLLGSGGGNGGTDGGGQGGGGPGGPGIGFFGAKAAGNSFIYVVDMSGSMQGGRFDRAISELIRSINQLKTGQKFYVVFFNDQPLPLYAPRPATSMQTATTSNRQRAVRWIRSIRPSSLTNPDRAIELALELRPDAIFLLTDGEFQDDVPSLIRKLNKGGVVIHTIAFEGREGEPMLEAIARENKGTYRFVK